MKRSSKIWEISKEDLQQLLDTSKSFSDVLRKLGYINVEGNATTLRSRIKEDSLNTTQISLNRKADKTNYNTTIENRKENEEVFIENSPACRSLIKSRILKDNLIDYKCRDCNITNIWAGKEITLHLEHCNGIGNDNRVETLCFLCPNCHSQTSTFSGKSKYKKEEK
jgi:Zn finger protein HypA/HybF involved in hydrogenase expression